MPWRFIRIKSGSLFAQTLNLNFSTYLGGNSRDSEDGISLKMDGIAYLTGMTY